MRKFLSSNDGENEGFRVLLLAAGVLSIVSIVILIIGIVLFQNPHICEEVPIGPSNDQKILTDFLKSVKEQYFKLNPNEIFLDPETTDSKLTQGFVPYDPSWQSIKKRTDGAMKLGEKLKNLKIDRTKLRPREKKGLAQLEHYLYSIFGKPYDENYYAGDWMMGPNYFCWQQICSIHFELRQLGEKAFSPKSAEDFNRIIELIKQFKTTIETYKENTIMGVNVGMVRSVEDCKAGLNAFKGKFPKIAEHGAKGVLQESYGSYFGDDKYYSALNSTVKSDFKTKYNMTHKEKLSRTAIEYFGEPLHEYIQYLQINHSRYCVPSNVASGLANLPLNNIWYDQKKTNTETTKRLPTGEILDGAKSYEMILPYFTTTRKYSAASINALGLKQRDRLYQRALQIAMNITGKLDVAEAVNTFKVDLNQPHHFFNISVIPDNENDELGGSRCKDMDSAKINCPVRYEAMMRWFKYVETIIARLDTLTVDMFYMAGDRLTTPGCPIKMVAKFNPSSGSQSYSSSATCSRPCYYQLPFFLKLPGPKYNAFSVAGHEARPGHHTQVQGFNEHFSESGRKDIYDWLNSNTYYTAFTEGWALYAENPLLATETDLYKNEPLQEYGMLKWQIWRALRLIIDTGLHARGMTMNESVTMFERYAWDTTDKSYKDTIRYMSDPGQATAYMIGQLAIWSIRNKTEEKFKEAGIRFDEKEFHYQVLSQGSSPIDYLHDYIDDYIQCKIDSKSRDDCSEVLDPKLAASLPKCEPIGTKERWQKMQHYKDMLREHYD